MHLNASPCDSILHKFQATSAFDGIQTSKWEEPNGAKGIMNQIEIVSHC